MPDNVFSCFPVDWFLHTNEDEEVSECMYKSCWFFFSLFFAAFLPALPSLFPFLPLVPHLPPLTGLQDFYIYLFNIFFCLPRVFRPSTSRRPWMDLPLRKGIPPGVGAESTSPSSYVYASAGQWADLPLLTVMGIQNRINLYDSFSLILYTLIFLIGFKWVLQLSSRGTNISLVSFHPPLDRADWSCDKVIFPGLCWSINHDGFPIVRGHSM